MEYADTGIARNLQGIAKVLTANLGTRVFYTQQGGYDTHASEADVHPKLLGDLSRAVSDFYADLREHNAADNVVMFAFTEFGRRVKDNGSGTDHGSGGVAFAIGDPVAGGMYGAYPSAGRRRPGRGRPRLQHRLPRRVRHAGRKVAGPGRQPGGGRQLRAAGVCVKEVAMSMILLDVKPDIMAGSVVGGDSSAVFDAPITLYSDDGKVCRTVIGVVDTRVHYSVVPAGLLQTLGIAPQGKRRCQLPGGASADLPSARPRVTLHGKSGRQVILFGEDSGPIVIGQSAPHRAGPGRRP